MSSTRVILRGAGTRGLPGVNGVANDTATAAQINDPASQTRAALDDAVGEEIDTPGSAIETALSGTYETQTRVRETGVNVKAYGGIGDWDGAAGTDNLAAMQAAEAALPAGGGRIHVPAGDYRLGNNWNLTKPHIEVVLDPAATIRTTAATTDGHTVAYVGPGTLPTDTEPQGESFRWRGGQVLATGSGVADNALGAVRVKSCHISDVVVEADRKGITTQYGVDQVVIERFRVNRAGLPAVAVETGSHLVTLRDGWITSATGRGVDVMSSTADTSKRIRDLLLDNIRVDASGKQAFHLERVDRLTLRKLYNATAPTDASDGLYIIDCTNVTLHGDCNLTSIGYGAGVTHKAALPGQPITLLNGWVNGAAPYGPAAVRRTSDGMLVLTGFIQSGTATAGTQIGTLPPGYRPAVRERFACCDLSAVQVADLYAEPNGALIIARAASATGVFLSGITIPGGV